MESGNMKLESFLYAFICTLSVACIQEERFEGNLYETPDKVYAVIAEDTESKTYLGDEIKVLWSRNDAITTYLGSTRRGRYIIESGCVGSTEGSFIQDTEYKFIGTGSGIGNNIAFYPFCEASCKAVEEGYTLTGITLPDVQTYVPESFGEGAFPMIAVTRHTEDYEFHFKNLCGALKLQLTGSAVVKEVKLTGNAAESLSGKAIVYGFKDNLSPQIQMQEDASESVTLDCGSGVQLNEASPTAFILALPPVEFEKGFTVTITTADGKTGTLSTEKKNPVVRSHMLQMPVIKFETAGPVISDGDYYDEFGINHGPGTEIDGVIWAPVNCGYHETDYPWGKLYQWGRRLGFGYNDSNEYTDATWPTEKMSGVLFTDEAQSQYYADIYFTGGTNLQGRHTWSYVPINFWTYSPCPEGWQLPSSEDFSALAKNSSQWTVHNGITGYWYSGSSGYSESVPRVFLPSSGKIDASGTAGERCENGYYWIRSGEAGIAESFATSTGSIPWNEHLNAFSVRCVRYPSQTYEYTTEITLENTELSMENHETVKLSATVTKSSGNTSKSVFWDSDRPEIARVSQKGEITAISEGEARISATSGNITVYCSVNVTPRKKHEGDYIDEYGINHGPGTVISGVTWAPVNCGHHEEYAAGGKCYQWGRRFGQYSFDSRISGPVDLVEYQSDEYADNYINEGLSIWRDDLWTDEYKSEYDPCPEGWTIPDPYTYRNLVTNVAEVSRFGQTLIWASGAVPSEAGGPSIGLKRENNFWTNQSEDQYRAVGLTMYENSLYPFHKGVANLIRCIKGGSTTAVTGIYINKSSLSLTVRESARLQAAVSPSAPSHKYIEWSSDSPTVASVDADGTVTAKSAGKAVITAMSGLKTDECVVTVSSSPYAVKYIDENGIDQGEGIDIDGVIWAPVNCGYHETDFPWGKLYQWGRMYGQGYSDSEYSDAVIPQLDDNGFSDINSDNNADKFFTGTYYYPDQSQWNAGTASSPVKGEYDPCPEGWRVPTSAEIGTLLTNRSQGLEKNSLEQDGIWASGSRPCTDREMRIFLPLAGSRNSSGTAGDRGKFGQYWATDYYSTYYGTFVSYWIKGGFYGNYYNVESTGAEPESGYSVRCVQEDPNAVMIQATGLDIGAQELTLEPSQTHTFSSVITPSNATTRTIRWSSSDKFVASIDNGRLTAVSAGTAVITAKVGTVTAICTVTVAPRYQEGYYIDEYGVNHGEGINIDGKIWAPVNCGYNQTYDPNGKYYQWGRKYGQTGNSQSDSYRKLLEGPVSAETGEASKNRNNFYTNQNYPYNWLEPLDATLWNSGTEEHPVKTEYDPCPEGWRVPTKTEMNALQANASSEMTVSSRKGKYFSGSNTYSDKGQRLFLAYTDKMFGSDGNTTRMYDAEYYQTSAPQQTWNADGYSLRCIKDTDELAEIPVMNLEIESSLKILKEHSKDLNIVIYPANATSSELIIRSSDISVATVDNDGVVTGVSAGNAVITVKCGNKSAECTVEIWEMNDYISHENQNYGKGIYINDLAWAPVNEYDYFSYWSDFSTVCPSGWRLPTESEMRALMRNGNDFHFTGTTPYSEEATSIYLPPKGRYNIDKERYQFEGENAYLWTSTTYSGWRTFVYGTESGIGYSDSDNGLLKMSVRCVQE